jgi:hypothetical protein
MKVQESGDKLIKITKAPAYFVIEVRVFDNEGTIIIDPFLIPEKLTCQTENGEI